MSEESTPLLAGQPKRSTWRYYLLEVIVFLFCAAHSIGDLTSYQYVYTSVASALNYTEDKNSTNDKECIANKSYPNYVLEQKVAKEAAMYQLYFGLAAGIPGVLACVIFGTYSDKIGRRFMMVISMVGIGGRAAVYVGVCHWNLSLYYLYIGYAVEGISGSLPTMVLGIMAYSADISAVGKARTLRLVVVNAVGGLATAAAYVISGYTIVWLGYDYTFAVVVGTFLVACILILFLPESRQGQGMEDMTFRQYLYRAVKFYFEGSRTNPNRYFYIFSMLAFTCAIIINNCIFGTETLFMLNSPLCWMSVKIGDFGAAKQTFERVLGVSLIALLLRCCREHTIIVVIGILYISSLSVEAFATNDMFMIIGKLSMIRLPKLDTLVVVVSLVFHEIGLMFFHIYILLYSMPNLITRLTGLFYSFCLYIAAGLGVGSPSFSTVIRSVLSGNTDKDHQGALFASTQLCSSIFTATGTILLSAIYEWTVELMPGGVFLVMAGIILLAMAFMGIVHYLITRREDISLKTI